MPYLVIRQGVIDRLGSAQKVSLKKVNAMSLAPVVLLDEKPECPWAAGVFKLEDDWDTLNCVETNWDTSD